MEKKRRPRRTAIKRPEPNVPESDIFSELDAQLRSSGRPNPHWEIYSQVAGFLQAFQQSVRARETRGNPPIDGFSPNDINGLLNSVDTAEACERAYLAVIDLNDIAHWRVREPDLASMQRAWFDLGMLTHELATNISQQTGISADEIIGKYVNQLKALGSGNNHRKSKAEIDKKRTIDELLRRSKENPRASKTSILTNMANSGFGHIKTLLKRCVGVEICANSVGHGPPLTDS